MESLFASFFPVLFCSSFFFLLFWLKDLQLCINNLLINIVVFINNIFLCVINLGMKELLDVNAVIIGGGGGQNWWILLLYYWQGDDRIDGLDVSGVLMMGMTEPLDVSGVLMSFYDRG